MTLSGVEVTQADGADPAFLVQLFHRSPGAVHIPKGLVDQVKIQSFELQAVHRSFKRLSGDFIAGILNPQLGGDKQFFSRHAASLNGSADRLFIAI